MSLKKQAEACFQQNNLAEAIILYTRILQADKNDLDALFMLGAIHGQQNSLHESAACFRKVVQKNPDHYPAWDNLGIALMLQGENSEAESCLRKAIQINPNYEQGYNNLGNLLIAKGSQDEAINCYQQALHINPGYSEAHNNLGNLFFEQEKYSDAVGCYQHALQLNPQYSDAHSNLGIVLHKLGKSAEAITSFQQALQIQPNNPEIHRHMGRLYWDIDQRNDAAASTYKVLETFPDDIDTFPRGAALLAVLNIPHLPALIVTAKPAGLNSLKQFILDGNASLAFENKILIAAMFRIILSDLGMEALFTKLRKICLQAVLHGSKQDFDELFGNQNQFIIALAYQCFNNEYVYFVDDEEYAALGQLSAKIKDNCNNGTLLNAALQRLLAVFAMYIPLYRCNDLNILLVADSNIPECLQELIRQQVLEPAEEEKIRNEIPSLTLITDSTSQKVGQQYDEAPFPRWLGMNLGTPRSYRTILKSTLKETCQPVKYPEKRIKILVAGCGTGLHALGTAAQYTDADILAIDISINCLAYAKRKAGEMEISNVIFKHADILKLGDLQERFHIIEVVGVLQTMSDPNQGLDILASLLHPEGFMKIATYSKQARKSITEASTHFKQCGFTAQDDDIRQLRQEIISMDINSPLRHTATHLWDFYSLSECRNLFFLVHEVLHTIDDIIALLDHANLEFLLFTFANKRPETHFQTVFPGDNTPANLKAWNEVEARYPNTFINMYTFWCRHKTAQT